MKSVKLILKFLFIIVAFYIIYQKIDINELKSIKIQNYFFLFLAFLLFNLSQIISAFRLNEYLKSINLSVTNKSQTMLYYVGMFYNTLLPGGIGGDAYKAYLFNKNYQIPYKKIIKAMLIDRLSGLFAILLILAIALMKFNVLFLASVAVPLILLILAHKIFFKEFSYKPFFYSIIIQALQGGAFLFIVASISKVNIDYLILFFISSIVSVIPISIGGVGLRELTFLYGVKFFNIDPTIGVVSAFLFFLISLISSVIGVIFLERVKNV
ncbi:MAG: flippase-like domain-containing protein [Epsilonproteobacteria bacterium]|nr:flippase-like domain-containing protein [Campylobacterota bacterium]